MLLDFPLDPDQSTMEIISDSVYANSSVLDGRRFASDFVQRRKADTAKARGGSGAVGSPVSSGVSGGVGSIGGWGKSVSIADGELCLSSLLESSSLTVVYLNNHF